MELEPIYKTKDGQKLTKSQLVNSGYTEDNINEGIGNKVLSLIGDTQSPDQQFKTKDGQVVTTKDLLESGYLQKNIDSGVHDGILEPLEKKNLGGNGSKDVSGISLVDVVPFDTPSETSFEPLPPRFFFSGVGKY